MTFDDILSLPLQVLVWCLMYCNKRAFLVVNIQHSSLVHIGLSTWALLSYGPGVESVYGSIGFGMIYLIGGLFGNLLSFFHTPEGTVGGTVSFCL